MRAISWTGLVASCAIGCGVHSPVLAAASDTVFVHAHIYTGDPSAAWADAIAITGARIDAIGAQSAVRKYRGSRTRVIDLHGKTVIPGIVDSHTHLLYGAFALHGLNLSTPEASITPDQPDVLVERLQAYAAAHPTDEIVLARADFSATPPTTPTAALLDRVSADRPIVVHNTSEHALWLNSTALKLAGVTNLPVADRDEERGVVRDASGHPTGVLLEAAMELAARWAAGRIPVEKQLAMVQAATRYLNSYGITSVVNATGNLAELKLYATLRDRGTLTVRTRTSFGSVAVQHHLTPQFLADLELARRTYHDEWVSANLVKFFADGATGLVPPLVYSPQDYQALVMELDQRGYQIMTHALRADSVHMILDTYEQLAASHGTRDRRLRIEHADFIDDADIPRFTKLGVIADMQPTFCCGDETISFDPTAPAASDRWKTLEQSGVTLAFSSDWPCTWPPSPFVSIQETATRQAWISKDTAGVTGTPLDGTSQGGARPTGKYYTPAERISVESAVKAYTMGSAYAAFADAQVGSLEVGKLADLAVLSQDIFAVPAESIAGTQVVMTMVGGRIVHGSIPR